MLTLKQGSELVKLARKAIEDLLSGAELVEIKEAEKFTENQGVFVTLNSYPSKELRGCIGFPYPIMPLGEAIVKAAQAAAFQDPRFLPLSKEELPNIIVEISVLTKPKIIDCSPTELAKNIVVGRDGLICSYQDNQGLLLPQVPAEWGWNAKQFIEQTCVKVGLPATVWQNKDCKFYKFRAQIFSEEKPNGKIVAKKEGK